MKAFIAYAQKVPAAAAQIKANLKLPLPATFVKFGTAGFGGFADYYTGDAKAAFAEVKDEALQKQFDEAAAKAAAAMKDLAAYVGSQPGTADGYALGADKFAKMILANEAVDTPLVELERIGQADLKRNQDALKAACATYAAGMAIGDCMKQMNSDKPADGPVPEASRQLHAPPAFLADTDPDALPAK